MADFWFSYFGETLSPPVPLDRPRLTKSPSSEGQSLRFCIGPVRLVGKEIQLVTSMLGRIATRGSSDVRITKGRLLPLAKRGGIPGTGISRGRHRRIPPVVPTRRQSGWLRERPKGTDSSGGTTAGECRGRVNVALAHAPHAMNYLWPLQWGRDVVDAEV